MDVVVTKPRHASDLVVRPVDDLVQYLFVRKLRVEREQLNIGEARNDWDGFLLLLVAVG